MVVGMGIKPLLSAAGSPPLPAIVDAELSCVSLLTDSSLASVSDPSVVLSDGGKLHGTDRLLRLIGCTSNLPNFYGATRDESNQIDEWLKYASVLSSGPAFERACKYIDECLEKRTFIVGHCLSVADIAVWYGLAGVGSQWESLRKSTKKYQNLVRWFNSISSEYDNVLSEVLAKHMSKRGGGGKQASSKQGTVSQTKTVNSDASDKGKYSKKATAEVDLPGAEVGKVCLRFAPEPSGYLHIGHAKAALSNQLFAQQYQAKVILRFDDTNPTKEKKEFKDNIAKDVETLGFNYVKVTYTSDYFHPMLEMAGKLIKQGKAYVDDTPTEKMKEERKAGIESKCRSNSLEEHLKLWKEMIAGSDRGQQCCLRGKLDMQDPNKSLRDPVYYRCNPVPHDRTGTEYNLYPTYDFACPFVDSLEGITHALRASEYYDRKAQYDRIQADMGIRKVETYEFSRLNFVYTLLSKRDLSWFVDKGKVDGWDDPRLPTVQGIVRRGLKIEALIQFIDEQRASKNLNLMEWDKLWSINKKIIDPVCPRHTAVVEDKRVLLTLTDGPEKPFVRIIPRHKKYEGAGEKCTTYTKRIWIDYADAACISAGEEITLMDWGNAVVKEIKKDQEGSIKNLTGVLSLEGSVKTTKLKLTWLPDTNELVSLSLHEFDYLITKKKLEKKKDPHTGKKKREDFRDHLNPCTKKVTAALGDSDMRNLKRGDVLQLERKGYFRCDVPYVGSSKPIVLFAIPDGRQQTVSK